MRLVDHLEAEIAQGPVAAAVAVRDAVALDAQTAAALADDPDVDPTVRVAALLAIALVAQDGIAVPDAALSALEDDVLVDAVLASAAASAVTGIVYAAKERVGERLRRYLALRITAGGATGVHVAELLLGVGEVDAAIRAVTPALIATLREVTDDDPIALALAMIVHDWTRAHAALDERIAAGLPELQREKLARALRAVVS